MSCDPTRLPREVTNDAFNSINPNARKNRVPSEVELGGLRKLIESNLEVEKVIQDQVMTLRTSQKALSDLLIRQQLELESTQSELFETKNLIESLELQRTALQKRTHNLRALIHPIRQLPTEVLTYIFELTVRGSVAKVQAASVLSAVCRSWREITFDTPRLWSTIKSFALPDSETLWPQWVRLVRAFPTDIGINDIEEADLPVLRRWQLSKIPNVKVLTLNLSYPAIIDALCEDLFDASYMPLSELTISLAEENSTEVHLDTLLGYVSSLTTLRLEGSISLHAGPNAISSLVALVLIGTPELDFHGIMQSLPLLETLDLDDVTFAIPNGSQIVTSANIRRLKICTTPIFEHAWVTSLRFPRLASLFHGNPSTPFFVEFVKSHPSIRELDYLAEDEEELVQYASAVPGLTHLAAASAFTAFLNWRQAGLLEVPFPSLRVLMFGDHETPPDLVEFEGVIRTRCLPMNHPKSLLERESLLLKELRVLVATREWEGEAWALHALAQEASREIVPYEELDGWNCVVLRWNAELNP